MTRGNMSEITTISKMKKGNMMKINHNMKHSKMMSPKQMESIMKKMGGGKRA